MDSLKTEAAALYPQLKELKDTLHRAPELSMREYVTTALLKEKLKALGLKLVDTGLETGAVAVLEGALPGNTVALRADIDAIAELESPLHAIRSETDGVMHACGHDFHTACLYGAAALLAERKESLHGRVIFLFQPAEETVLGAAALLENGLWQRVGAKPACMFALHTRPELPCSQIAVIDGPIMAGKTNFKVTIRGRSGHGGSPHKCVDPVVAGAAFINGIQTIVSRNTDPFDALVCAVCSVHTDAPDYFVPSSLTLTGSIRFQRDEAGNAAQARLKDMAEGIRAAYGCTSEITFAPLAPVTKNPGRLVPLARRAAAETVGEAGVVSPRPDMGGEDFALFGKELPAFFYWLGTGFPDKENAHWHSPDFETDDDALPLGAELLARSALLWEGRSF
ncbi:MAG TPA: M20 family metallopeptidase [Clostridia bacterium]|nr:M20 family metallopeptidase [Clostridia bacterium]